MKKSGNRASALSIFILALMVLFLGTALASETLLDSPPAVCIDDVHENLNERIERTEPTCISPGREEMVVFCIDCGTEIYREVMQQWDALNHSWSDWTVAQPASCEADGSETRRCIHDASHVETRVLPALGHAWSEWAVAQPASCEADGLEARHCVHDASHTETRALPALGHSWSSWTVAQPATCEADGSETRHCIHDANHTETRSIEALGHAWGEWTVSQPASCEASGTETRHCVHDASHAETRSIEALGHAWGEWTVSQPASCEVSGTEARHCMHDAAHAETRSIEALGHAWGEWTVTQAADCMTDGTETRWCAHDTAHTETRTLPATGHSWLPWRTTLRPTCDKTGTEVRICANNATHHYSRDIEPLGHQYRLIRSRPATCTSDGSDRYLCTRNLRHYRIDTHPALGHQWGDWEVVKPATIREEGEEQRICARDGRHVETRVIEKIPSLRLTSKTSVDLAGLMYWDQDINRDHPVIRVNGKSLGELSEEEKDAIRNNRETMVFLLNLVSDTANANVPDTLLLPDLPHDLSDQAPASGFTGLEIQVDRTRLSGLVKEASKRQDGRDLEIVYKQEEEAKKKQEEETRKVLEQVQADQNGSAAAPPAQNIEITLVFRKEEEKVKFEETKQNDNIQITKYDEPKDETPKKKCLTPDTLITLADGSQKRVDELSPDDKVLVWDFDLGILAEAPLTFLHSVSEEAAVLRACFSDGTSVGIIGEHVLFDLTDRQFVVLSSASQKEALLGHSFAKLSDGQITGVALTDLFEDGVTDSYYSPVSEAHFNCFANGMLNISGFMQGFFNVFDLEPDALKYDAEKKAAEIEAAGELPYEIFNDLFPRELYERNKVGWLSVSITKGLVNPEDLYDLFEFCIPFFVGN